MSPKKSPAVAVPAVESLAITIPQAAQMLNCSVRAVRSLLWAKKLPHLKIGKRFVIPVASLREFVTKAAV